MSDYPIVLTPLEQDVVEERKKFWSGPYSTMNELLVSSNPSNKDHTSIKIPKRFLEIKDDIYQMEIKSDDLILVTYPKCGSTWLQEMLWQLQKGVDLEGGKSPLFFRVPLLELESLVPKAPGLPDKTVAYTKGLESPRIFKTHLPLDFFPPKTIDTAKFIYLGRNPKDVCVSFYHHEMLLQNHGWTGTFDDYVDHFAKGEVAYGNQLDHLVEGWRLNDKANVKFLWYEDLKKDLVSVMKEIVKFMGWEELSEEKYRMLEDHLSFKSFQKNKAVNMEPDGGSEEEKKDFKFIRKGQVGDWRNFFSEEKAQLLNTKIQNYAEKYGIAFPADTQ